MTQEWKEYPQLEPDRKANKLIWMCNVKSGNLTIMSSSFMNGDFTHWMPIEEPQLPKPKLHRCESAQLGSFCYEDTDKSLRLSINMCRVEMQVDYCPFCGYSPKEKE